MPHRILLVLLAVAVGSLLAAVGCSRAPAPGSTSASTAFIAHDVREAHRIYAAIPDSVEPRDLVRARIRLAALEWRFFLDSASASTRLAAGLGVGAERSSVLAEWARMETGHGRFREAAERALEAYRSAETEGDRTQAAVRVGEAAVAAAERALLVEGRLPDADESRRLAEALELLRPLVQESPGVLDPSRLLLTIAVLLDRGADAWEAWRSYYVVHLGRGGPLPAAADTLSSVLPGWAGPATPIENRRAVIRALAASAFHGPALLLIVDPRIDPGQVRADPRVRDLEAYARFLHEVEVFADEYYRRTALGEGDPDDFRTGLFRLAQGVWPGLSWAEEAPEFNPEAFVEELRKRFDAVVNVGLTAGYLDLHFGHVVVDEPRTVVQYGHRAELRYVALDGIVSNGFQSWAWDGLQAHGGWATNDVIYQVRPRYADGPIRAWWALTDPSERERRARTHAADSVSDLERARRDPHGYLPGLRSRMASQGMRALYDSLSADGLRTETLRSRFLAIYAEAIDESSIFAHEGRHAIDRRLELELDLEEREYRGKLSEVAFAPRPRLALGAILNPNIGGGTPHGRANRRIVEGLVDWMSRNRADILDLDPTLPLLPQLSLLTDEQLRSAFRSMDSMSGG